MLLRDIGEDQLDSLLTSMGREQLAKMESLYLQILAFRDCSTEELPSKVGPGEACDLIKNTWLTTCSSPFPHMQYVEISRKMEQLHEELLSQAPRVESQLGDGTASPVVDTQGGHVRSGAKSEAAQSALPDHALSLSNDRPEELAENILLGLGGLEEQWDPTQGPDMKQGALSPPLLSWGDDEALEPLPPASPPPAGQRVFLKGLQQRAGRGRGRLFKSSAESAQNEQG